MDHRVLRWGSAAAAASVAVAVVAATASAPASAVEAPGHPSEQALTLPPVDAGDSTRYLVSLEPGTPARAVVSPDHILGTVAGPAYQGVLADLSPARARDLRREDGVAAVEPDRPITLSSTAAATPWGLDRVDQADLPLDGRYTPANDGSGVHVFVIDSGIDTGNPDFSGRIGDGAYDSSVATSVEDENGHGTHVAGTIGSDHFGVAKGVTLHPVRVLDGSGSGYTSGVVAGLNWVGAHAPAGSVVNLSLGGTYSPAVNSAAASLVAAGHVVTVAAGNDGRDACLSSPASEPSVLTVGATDRSDRQTSYSNNGSCVDLYAPGDGILSTSLSGSGGQVMSGTSMAAPHVAGAAAVYLAGHPGVSGAQAGQAIRGDATFGVVSFPNGQGASPNRLLRVMTTAAQPASAPEAATPTAGNPATAPSADSTPHAAPDPTTSTPAALAAPHVTSAKATGRGKWRTVRASWSPVPGADHYVVRVGSPGRSGLTVRTSRTHVAKKVKRVAPLRMRITAQAGSVSSPVTTVRIG